MSASFTFGSFGDIITTVQLVWRLSQAISDSHGSAQEFQELVEELNRFHRTLDELLKFWQSRTQSVEFDRLADSLKPAIDDCREAIESFLKQQFRKYARSFSPQKQGRKSIGDVFKRIRWSIVEKEKVTQLRDKLRRNKELIDVVHAIALRIAQEQDRDLLAATLDNLANADAHAANQLEQQFGKVIGFLEAQATVSANADNNVVTILSELRTEYSRISKFQTEIASTPRIRASLNPYMHNIVFIEDALGATIVVPLAINPSWETVGSMMKDQFRHRAGQELVRRKKYVLQDFITGKDLNLTTEFHNLVRPGQTLAMAMMFEGTWLNGEINGKTSCCPKCGQEQLSVVQDGDTTCMNTRCNFIFRGVLDLSELSDDAIDKWLSQAEVDQHSTVIQRDEQDPTHDLTRLIAERENIEGPNIFKRVRYISRWEDLEDSRGGYIQTIDGISFWNFGDNGWAENACYNISGLAGAEVLWRLHMAARSNLNLNMYRCLLSLRFAGYTKKSSVPVVFLETSSQESRRRLLGALRSLDFVAEGRIQLMAVIVPNFETCFKLDTHSPHPRATRLAKERLQRIGISGQ